MQAVCCSCDQGLILIIYGALRLEFFPPDSVLLAVASYDHLQVPKWTSAIIEGCIKSLTALNKPFKYVGESRGEKWEKSSTEQRVRMCTRVPFFFFFGLIMYIYSRKRASQTKAKIERRGKNEERPRV